MSTNKQVRCKYCKCSFPEKDFEEHILESEPEGRKVLEKIRKEADDLEYSFVIGDKLWKQN